MPVHLAASKQFQTASPDGQVDGEILPGGLVDFRRRNATRVIVANSRGSETAPSRTADWRESAPVSGATLR